MKLFMRLITAAAFMIAAVLLCSAGAVAQTAALGSAERTCVIPCGTPFGVKLYTDGVIVIDTEEIVNGDYRSCPAEEAGIKKGDIIISADGKDVMSNDGLAEIINSSMGKSITFGVQRDGELLNIEVTPEKTGDNGEYKAGLWIRDSCAGIGTVTFYEPESHLFAALGHGICDTDTKKLLPSTNGEIVRSRIEGISKGVRGVPGGLNGCFTDDEPIGRLAKNSEYGVFGTLSASPSAASAMPVAFKNEVQTGDATVLSTIEGEKPERFDIKITSINYEACNNTKNMVIEITDKKLLDKTGGIVQGMSGSPIIQNDMVVGAVTHVFVNDPAKGYAIFAETMLETGKASCKL